MWIVLARQPRPPAQEWPGRRLLASADAIGWPTAWIVMVSRLTFDVGLIGRVSIAVALLFGAQGAWIALRHNERYHFITLRAWRLVWPLLALGAALQVAFWLVR